MKFTESISTQKDSRWNSNSNDRLIATRLSDLQKMKQVVGVAGGERKPEALRGTLRGNLISTLITDEHTAQALLQ